MPGKIASQKISWLSRFVLVASLILSACQSTALPSSLPPTQVTQAQSQSSPSPSPSSEPTRILSFDSQPDAAQPEDTAAPGEVVIDTIQEPSVTPDGAQITPSSSPNPSPTSQAAFTTDPNTYPGLGGQSYLGPVGTPFTGETYPYLGGPGGIFSGGSQVNPTLPPTSQPALPPTSTPRPNQGGSAPTPTHRPTTSQPLPSPLPTSAMGDVLRPLQIPPGGRNPTVVIWHSWDQNQLNAVDAVLRLFQQDYPQVSFDLVYIPLEELQAAYLDAALRGAGPDVLAGPAEWSGTLWEQQVVAGLQQYYTSTFLDSIVAPARDAGFFRSNQVCLPYAMDGVVLYRNTRIVSAPAASWDKLVESARRVTRGGNIGAYLEQSWLFSGAHLLGLDGSWLDESGQPVFDAQSYAKALAWMELVTQDFRQAGAVALNTSRDLTLFQQGKVGWIIEGTWNLSSLSQTLGSQSLAVDPWPTYSSGHLSGFVQAEGFYLNRNTAKQQNNDLVASLQFIGAMLSPSAQSRLAQAGYLPSITGLQLENSLQSQAVLALSSGSAYPPALQAEIQPIYTTLLDNALQQSSLQETSNTLALLSAFQEIRKRLDSLGR